MAWFHGAIMAITRTLRRLPESHKVLRLTTRKNNAPVQHIMHSAPSLSLLPLQQQPLSMFWEVGQWEIRLHTASRTTPAHALSLHAPPFGRLPNADYSILPLCL
jgi:hypothetical protein